MVLCLEELGKFDISEADIEGHQGDYLMFLNQKRDKKTSDAQKNDIKTLGFLKKKHDESFKIRDYLTNNTGNDSDILNFAVGMNRSASF